MLTFLLGRSHSGKTQRVLSQLAALPESGRPVYLLLPDQSTFEGERRCYRTLGARAFSKIQVTGFSRLASRLAARYYPQGRPAADARQKLLLMQLALEQAGPLLKVYASPASRSRLAPAMLQTVEQLQSAGMEVSGLEDFARTLPQGSLRSKLLDTAAVYAEYQGLLQRRFSDPLEDLPKAARLAAEHRLFEGGRFYLDGFDFLSQDKLLLLEQMLLQGEQVTVTLTLDPADPRRESLFALSDALYHQLRALARKLGVPVATPEVLPQPEGVRPPALEALERRLYAIPPVPYDQPAQELELIRAPNRQEEVQAAAARLRELARQGYRYREIAVVLGSESYRPLLQSALERYEVPYYLDDPVSPLQSPLFRLVQHCFALGSGSFSPLQAAALLKCGLTPFDESRVAELENYLYLWDLGEEGFFSPFTLSIYGLEGPRNPQQREEETARLARLEEMRKFLLDHLLPFRKLGECSAREMTQGLFDLLEGMQVRQVTQQYIQMLEQDTVQPAQSLAAAAQYRRMWETLGQLCTAIAEILEDRPVSFSRYWQLLELLAEQSGLETVPQALDCVNVGQSGKLHLEQVKVLLILGAEEGVFPQTPAGCPLFGEEEEELLAQRQLPIARDRLRRTQEGRFYAYQTLTGGEQRLWISVPEGDLQGSAIAPSPLLEELAALFPQCRREELARREPARLCQSKEAGFALLAAAQQPDVFTKTLEEYFSRSGEYAAMLEQVRQGRKNAARKLDRKLVEQLYGQRPFLSPSRVEDFYRCPFQFFCKQGLKLYPRRQVRYDPLSRGNLVHEILCKVLEQLRGREDLTPEKLQSLAEECVRLYLEQHLPKGSLDNARLRVQLRRAGEGVTTLLLELAKQIQHSRFFPAAFEYRIGEGGHSPALTVSTQAGNQVSLHGTVDRIDLYQDSDGTRYFRIVDYKTGAKQLKLSDVLQGLNLQMMIYLICLEQGRGGQGAGVLYQPAGQVSPKLGREASQAQWEREKKKSYRMNGLVLNQKSVVLAMDDTLSGESIPVKALAKGYLKDQGAMVPQWDLLFDDSGKAVEELFDKNSQENIIDAYQLQLVTGKVLDKIREMADRLFAGEIAPSPVETQSGKACQWCDYATLCRAKDGPVRSYERKSNKQVLQELKGKKKP